MWLVGLGVFAVIAALAGIAKGQSARMTSEINIKSPGLASWEPVIKVITAEEKIPWQFAMAWIAVESSGNACAIGNKDAKGPDGNPREMGIAQLYNPDDLKRFGVTGKELRAYCVPGTQKLSRPLTPEEIGRQVRLAIELMKHSARQSAHYLTDAGIHWSTTGKDYWRAVKLWHALPVIPKYGFVSVSRKLGHPPATWTEFRRGYEAVNPRARYNPLKDRRNQDGYWRALQNAEETGAFVPDLVNV